MLAELPKLAADSVDSVVCDPPYHLTSIVKRFGADGAAPAKDRDGLYARASAGFMGKQWDGGDIAFRPETWAEVLRVLKPGGHLLAFGGTRGYHRMTCAIEDAGFEIRDSIMWLYGWGFPKSHDVSKGIDKTAGVEREVVGQETLTNDIRGGALLDVAHGTVRPALVRDKTIATSPEAQQWQGWGTALKPAYEPIVVARKPLIGTVAENVLRHGTGAINVDGCRVGTTRDVPASLLKNKTPNEVFGEYGGGHPRELDPNIGRWPANVIHDGSEEVLAAFPETGESKAGGRSTGRNFGQEHSNAFSKDRERTGHNDNGGSAARFFYSAKADQSDRLGSKHPTVKPVDLMAYLCRLVTPPGGTVLDPFAGSGSTGMACLREGFDAVLIEREAEYVADIKRRIAHVSGEDAPLFTTNAPPPPHIGPQNLRGIRRRKIGPTGLRK